MEVNIKEKFLTNELWMLTIAGAFQRANIYTKVAKENRRIEFRKNLRNRVLEVSSQYKTPVSEHQHVTNIIYIINTVKDDILNGGQLSFGSAQKLLNLFLKYEWCRGLIPEPPHCPVDRIVLTQLSKYNPESWTKIDGPRDYIRLIKLLKGKALGRNESLAEWELGIFNKRTSKL